MINTLAIFLLFQTLWNLSVANKFVNNSFKYNIEVFN